MIYTDLLKRAADGVVLDKKLVKWDRRFLALAKHVASWSKDPSTQTGAVIVTPEKTLVSVGFNGFPRGVADDERLHDRPTKYQIIVHCEMNAVLTADRPVRGCWLYTWPFASCTPCAARMIQAGIARAVAPTIPDHLRERWGEDLERADALYNEAGVETLLYPHEEIA